MREITLKICLRNVNLYQEIGVYFLNLEGNERKRKLETYES